MRGGCDGCRRRSRGPCRRWHLTLNFYHSGFITALCSRWKAIKFYVAAQDLIHRLPRYRFPQSSAASRNCSINAGSYGSQDPGICITKEGRAGRNVDILSRPPPPPPYPVMVYEGLHYLSHPPFCRLRLRDYLM